MKMSSIRTLRTLTIITVGSFVVAGTASAYAQSGSLTSSSRTGTGGSSSTSGTSGTGGASGFTGGIMGGAAAASAASPNATQQFIGANATQNFVGGARQPTNQQAANRQFQAFQNSQTTNSTSQSQTGTPREIRTVLAIGFSFPSATSAQQLGRLADVNTVSLNRFITNRPEFADMAVSLSSEGVAVLTGSAPTIDSSRLAANLVRLQPGVRKVENRIAVGK